MAEGPDKIIAPGFGRCRHCSKSGQPGGTNGHDSVNSAVCSGLVYPSPLDLITQVVATIAGRFEHCFVDIGNVESTVGPRTQRQRPKPLVGGRQKLTLAPIGIGIATMQRVQFNTVVHDVDMHDHVACRLGNEHIAYMLRIEQSAAIDGDRAR